MDSGVLSGEDSDGTPLLHSGTRRTVDYIKVGDEYDWNGACEIRSRDVGGTGSSVLLSRGMYVRKGWRKRRRRRVIRVVCFDATRGKMLIHSDLPFIDG